MSPYRSSSLPYREKGYKVVSSGNSMKNYLTTSFNPSGNRWIPWCGGNGDILRYPRTHTDPSKSTQHWIVGSASDDGQFLMNSNQGKVERLFFSSEGRQNVTIDGTFAPERPLVVLLGDGNATTKEDRGGAPFLTPIKSPPTTSLYSSAVPLPNGGYMWIDDGAIPDSVLLRYHSFDGENNMTTIVLDTVDSPLWDGSISYSYANEQWAVFHGATDNRYTHGALGDRYESYKLSILEWKSGENGGYIDVVWTVTLEDTSPVYEGLAPMWADLNDDGIDDILTTVATEGEGAQLRAYILRASNIDNTTAPNGPRYEISREAASDWIGIGNRWLHQLGVGPLGPNGETEIVQVRMPHLLAQVRYHKLSTDETRLEEMYRYEHERLSTHVYGDRNLDTVTIGDFNNDGTPEVVLADFSSKSILGLQRRSDGAEKVWSVGLPGRITSNIAVSCPDEFSHAPPQVLFSTKDQLVRLQFEDCHGANDTCSRGAVSSNHWWLFVFIAMLAMFRT